MSYKPILFNTEMVQAIQSGRKTQTRRVAKQLCDLLPRTDGLPPEKFDFFISPSSSTLYWEDLNRQVTVDGKRIFAPFTPGDILWVRETWTKMPHYVYRADDEHPEFWDFDDRWFPSIHMPKDAARIFLRVKDVRVEHLGDMRLHDCLNEGVRLSAAVENDLVRAPIRAREWFSQVWDSTIKPADRERYGWNANPWVWVIEFERCEKPADFR